MQALVDWKERNPDRLGVPSASLIENVDDLIDRPEEFFGRQPLIKKVEKLLGSGSQVLLQGFGGTGKTALAATLAAQWIEQQKTPVLWLQAGTKKIDALLQALVRPFSDVKNPDLLTTLRILRDSPARLLVLDDCWNGNALHEVQKAIPPGMSLLVTARQRYWMKNICSVEPLLPTDAHKLLAYWAGNRAYARRADTRMLCQQLGYLAFAVEIAGKTIKVKDCTPQELIDDINDAPHNLQTPANYSDEERASVKELLDASLHGLNDEARAVFLAFGALFTRSASKALLSLYRGQAVDDALDMLHIHGLAERIGSGDSAVFRLHDLAYSYAKSNQPDKNASRQKAIQACHAYTDQYSDDPDRLELDITNILSAAEAACDDNQDDLLVDMMVALGSDYFQSTGHTPQSLDLMREASLRARASKRLMDAYLLLRYQALYYQRTLEDNPKALELLEEALAVTRAIPDKQREMRTLLNIGTVHGDLALAAGGGQQVTDVFQRLEETVNIARQQGDEGMLCAALQNLAYYRMKVEEQKPPDQRDKSLFEQAMTLCAEAVTLAERLGEDLDDIHFNALLCQGGCALNLGHVTHDPQYYQQAAGIHERTHIYASTLKNEAFEAQSLEAWGEDLHYLGAYKDAQKKFNQAFELWNESGQKEPFDRLAAYLRGLQGYTYKIPSRRV
jgi:tetratricopeptide (TPR) repeat protein